MCDYLNQYILRMNSDHLDHQGYFKRIDSWILR